MRKTFCKNISAGFTLSRQVSFCYLPFILLFRNTAISNLGVMMTNRNTAPSAGLQCYSVKAWALGLSSGEWPNLFPAVMYRPWEMRKHQMLRRPRFDSLYSIGGFTRVEFMQ